MNGKLKVIAGTTGTGKTSVSMREFDLCKYGLVYDFQNQWHTLKYYDDNGNEIVKDGCKLVKTVSDLSKTRMRLSPENFGIYEYIHIIKNLRGFTMVIEEATGLFPNGRIPQEFIKTILSKRHTQNDFILVFHALHRVPYQIFEFIDELYLFNTYDDENNIKKKFNKIYPEWRHVQEVAKDNKHYYKTLLPPLS